MGSMLLVICLVACLLPVGTGGVFGAEASDIDGHWAEAVIQKWLERGAVHTAEQGGFFPDDAVSRNDLLLWAQRILESEESAGGEFSSEERVTREEAAQVLMDLGGLQGKSAAAGVYTDRKQLAEGRGAVGALYAASIMTGYPDGSFRGGKYITRSEWLVALDKSLHEKQAASGEAVPRYMVALGDSLAVGAGAEKGQGYVDLLYAHRQAGRMDRPLLLANLARPGRNSSELLRSVRTNRETIDRLLQADVILISIGGNNLLRPFREALAAGYQLDPSVPDFERELTRQALAPGGPDRMKEAVAAAGPALDEGVRQFKRDWPKILDILRELAPQAEIYAMTVYNPLQEGEPYYKTINSKILRLNRALMADWESREAGAAYRIADAYRAFSEYTGEEPLTGFRMLSGQFDVHPSPAGHQAIYRCHVEAAPPEVGQMAP